MDATQLFSEDKGMLYTLTTLDSNNQILLLGKNFFLGFQIYKFENLEGWSRFT